MPVLRRRRASSRWFALTATPPRPLAPLTAYHWFLTMPPCMHCDCECITGFQGGERADPNQPKRHSIARGRTQGNIQYPPPPPALVLPHPLCFPRGGGGGPSLAQPKIFRCSSLCCCGKTTTQECCPKKKKAFQWKVVSVCKSSRSSGAGPRKFTPSWSRSRSLYIGSPLNVSYAEFFRFMLQFLCLQMCVYGGSAVPQGGGWGTVTW